MVPRAVRYSDMLLLQSVKTSATVPTLASDPRTDLASGFKEAAL